MIIFTIVMIVIISWAAIGLPIILDREPGTTKKEVRIQMWLGGPLLFIGFLCFQVITIYKKYNKKRKTK